MYLKANFTLFHFVIFSKVESDFPYLLRFSSYGAMFEHHFWAKTPIFGHFWSLFDSPAAKFSWDRRFCGWFIIRGLGPTFPPNLSPIGGILGPQILLFSLFLTFSLKISSNQVATKLLLKISTKDTKSKPQTLPNRIVIETFAKNRMSKALSVQKKIAIGRTHRQTHRQILLFII